jgi:hypothetical protein
MTEAQPCGADDLGQPVSAMDGISSNGSNDNSTLHNVSVQLVSAAFLQGMFLDGRARLKRGGPLLIRPRRTLFIFATDDLVAHIAHAAAWHCRWGVLLRLLGHHRLRGNEQTGH